MNGKLNEIQWNSMEKKRKFNATQWKIMKNLMLTNGKL
jgi:hypothetical protein